MALPLPLPLIVFLPVASENHHLPVLVLELKKESLQIFGKQANCCDRVGGRSSERMETTPLVSRELHAPSSLSVLGTMVDSPRWAARTLK